MADHNNAFKPGVQPRVRFTQSAAVQPEDSLTRWRDNTATHTATLDLASPDHRALSLRPQSKSADSAAGTAAHAELGLVDIPGAYAYEDSAQGARLALRQMQSIDALRAQAQASGTLRSSAPGTLFTLTDHAQHDGADDARDRFVMLAVQHRVRNNLSADQRAQVEGIGAAIAQINARTEAGHTAHHVFGQAPQRNVAGINATDEPLYACRLTAQRATVPVRLGRLDAHGLPDPRIQRPPTRLPHDARPVALQAQQRQRPPVHAGPGPGRGDRADQRTHHRAASAQHNRGATGPAAV